MEDSELAAKLEDANATIIQLVEEIQQSDLLSHDHIIENMPVILAALQSREAIPPDLCNRISSLARSLSSGHRAAGSPEVDSAKLAILTQLIAAVDEYNSYFQKGV